MFDNRTYEIVIVAGIIRNALGTDKKLENCLYVGTATVSGDKTDNAKAYALTMQAAGYTVANNYIAAASAEDMTDDDVITVAVVCLNQKRIGGAAGTAGKIVVRYRYFQVVACKIFRRFLIAHQHGFFALLSILMR